MVSNTLLDSEQVQVFINVFVNNFNSSCGLP